MTHPRAATLVSALVVLALAACPAGAEPAREASPTASRASAVGPPGAESCPVFPADNIWHADVSTAPVHARSTAWLSSMSASTKKLHPDMGDSGEPMPYGIPYNVVPGTHPKTTVEFYYPDESDPGPYPLDASTPIEGGSDRHALIIDKDNCKLYELYDVEYAPNGGSTGGSGAIFDLRSNALRPAGWTSADAAGLPIFAGLVRQDEVARGVIDHAIRFTASRTDRSYVWPARHQAGAAADPNLPPMGARFRMKASFSISGYRADTQVFLKAFKKHGLILADNGSDWYFGGAAEPGWDNDLLDELKSIPASAFEAVDTSSMMVSANSAQYKTPGTQPPPTGPTINASDFAFSPKTTTLTSRGTVVTWSFNGPSGHTATDTTGMGLYGSGTKAAGTKFAYTFRVAGQYPFKCSLHAGMTGTVKVPVTATPSSGGTATTFTVTWSTALPATGFVYDVQIGRPGASTWSLWKNGVTAFSSTFVPDAGPGVYAFRARLRKPSVNRFSAYSAGAVVTVS